MHLLELETQVHSEATITQGMPNFRARALA